MRRMSTALSNYIFHHPANVTFNSIQDIGNMGSNNPVPGEVGLNTKKSNLKLSNFEHPILVDSRLNEGSTDDIDEDSTDTDLEKKDMILCSLVSDRIVGTINEVEETIRIAMDVLTFPLANQAANHIEVFGRFKAGCIMIVSMLHELSHIPPNDLNDLSGTLFMEEIVDGLAEAKEIAKALMNKSKKLVYLSQIDFNKWVKIQSSGKQYAPLTMKERQLYGGNETTFLRRQANIYEDLVKYEGERLEVHWSPGNILIKNEFNFMKLTFELQALIVQGIVRLIHNLLHQSLNHIQFSIHRIEQDTTDVEIRDAYTKIKIRIPELERQNKMNLVLSSDLKLELRRMSQRKADLLNVLKAFHTEVTWVYTIIKSILSYSKLVYDDDELGSSWIQRLKSFFSCCCSVVTFNKLMTELGGIEDCNLIITILVKERLHDLLMDETEEQSVFMEEDAEDTPTASSIDNSEDGQQV